MTIPVRSLFERVKSMYIIKSHQFGYNSLARIEGNPANSSKADKIVERHITLKNEIKTKQNIKNSYLHPFISITQPILIFQYFSGFFVKI